MLPCICPVIFRSQMTSKYGKNKKVAHKAIIVSRSTIISRRRKVEFIKWINLGNVLFIGFVKFEIMQWFTVYQDQFCVWLSLARLPTAGVHVLFSEPFFKESNNCIFLLPARFCFSYLFNASTIHFVLIFSQSCKILLISQNFPPF